MKVTSTTSFTLIGAIVCLFFSIHDGSCASLNSIQNSLHTLKFQQQLRSLKTKLLAKGSKDNLQINANAIIDKLLLLARPGIKSTENSLILPNWQQSFSKRFLFFEVYGTYGGYNGHLSGLENVYRSGDVRAVVKNGILTMEAGLRWRNVGISLTAYLHSSILSMTKGVKATVDGLTVRLSIVKNLKEFGSPVLKNLIVTSSGSVHCHISGLGILSGLVDSFASNAFDRHRGALVTVGQRKLRKTLLNALKRIEF